LPREIHIGCRQQETFAENEIMIVMR